MPVILGIEIQQLTRVPVLTQVLIKYQLFHGCGGTK